MIINIMLHPEISFGACYCVCSYADYINLFGWFVQISIDIEHAKCCICLNIWHDVVTVAPCFHNFWFVTFISVFPLKVDIFISICQFQLQLCSVIFSNGCFSEWLRRSQDKRTSVLCPHCRAVIQFVGRNHYLHNIEQVVILFFNELIYMIFLYFKIKFSFLIKNELIYMMFLETVFKKFIRFL